MMLTRQIIDSVTGITHAVHLFPGPAGLSISDRTQAAELAARAQLLLAGNDASGLFRAARRRALEQSMRSRAVSVVRCRRCGKPGHKSNMCERAEEAKR